MDCWKVFHCSAVLQVEHNLQRRKVEMARAQGHPHSLSPTRNPGQWAVEREGTGRCHPDAQSFPSANKEHRRPARKAKNTNSWNTLGRDRNINRAGIEMAATLRANIESSKRREDCRTYRTWTTPHSGQSQYVSVAQSRQQCRTLHWDWWNNSRETYLCNDRFGQR